MDACKTSWYKHSLSWFLLVALVSWIASRQSLGEFEHVGKNLSIYEDKHIFGKASRYEQSDGRKLTGRAKTAAKPRVALHWEKCQEEESKVCATHGKELTHGLVLRVQSIQDTFSKRHLPTESHFLHVTLPCERPAAFSYIWKLSCIF